MKNHIKIFPTTADEWARIVWLLWGGGSLLALNYPKAYLREGVWIAFLLGAFWAGLAWLFTDGLSEAADSH